MNSELRKDCPMRHECGNCMPAGGFCTAVNDPICEALHNAYDEGWRAAFFRAQQEVGSMGRAISNDELIVALRARAQGLEFSLRWLILEAVRRLEQKEAAGTNLEYLRTLEHYEMANAILNIGEDPCQLCPRDKEDRCNEDCNNGLVEWLASPVNPDDPVWTEH